MGAENRKIQKLNIYTVFFYFNYKITTHINKLRGQCWQIRRERGAGRVEHGGTRPPPNLPLNETGQTNRQLTLLANLRPTSCCGLHSDCMGQIQLACSQPDMGARQAYFSFINAHPLCHLAHFSSDGKSSRLS